MLQVDNIPFITQYISSVTSWNIMTNGSWGTSFMSILSIRVRGDNVYLPSPSTFIVMTRICLLSLPGSQTPSGGPPSPQRFKIRARGPGKMKRGASSPTLECLRANHGPTHSKSPRHPSKTSFLLFVCGEALRHLLSVFSSRQSAEIVVLNSHPVNPYALPLILVLDPLQDLPPLGGNVQP